MRLLRLKADGSYMCRALVGMELNIASRWPGSCSFGIGPFWTLQSTQQSAKHQYDADIASMPCFAIVRARIPVRHLRVAWQRCSWWSSLQKHAFHGLSQFSLADYRPRDRPSQESLSAAVADRVCHRARPPGGRNLLLYGIVRGGGGGHAAAGDGFVSFPDLLSVTGFGIMCSHGFCEHYILACNHPTQCYARRSWKHSLVFAVSMACFRRSIPLRVVRRCVLRWAGIGCPCVAFANHTALCNGNTSLRCLADERSLLHTHGWCR